MIVACVFCGRDGGTDVLDVGFYAPQRVACLLNRVFARAEGEGREERWDGGHSCRVKG